MGGYASTISLVVSLARLTNTVGAGGNCESDAGRNLPEALVDLDRGPFGKIAVTMT
jgi:hypothetical protein